jgi:hypothetical protein
MTDNFYPLTCDDDLLLIDKDTFTVARFKEFAIDSLSNFHEDPGLELLDSLNKYCHNIDKKIELQLMQSSWSFISASVECKLLSLTSGKGWISGKLRIKSTVGFLTEDDKNFTYKTTSESYPKSEIEMELQFCPDDPKLLETSDSALDELRQQLQIYK